MAVNKSQMRVLYLYKWLTEESSSTHPLTTAEILKRWDALGVPSDRRSVYRDIDILTEFGCEIECVRGATNSYYAPEKTFTLSELKILIDAVGASQAIPANETKRLIRKLLCFASPEEQLELERPIYLDRAYKNTNPQFYATTDVLYKAIRDKKKVSFNYLDVSVDKKKVYRHEKKLYIFSPYFLKWDRDKYYVVGWSDDHNDISHFRVDRIANIQLINLPAAKKPQGFNATKYGTQVFGMYSADAKEVTLRCENGRMKDVLDKFGKNVPARVVDDNHFDVVVDVEPSPPFFGWVFQYGGQIQIMEPEDVRKTMKKMIQGF